MPCRAVPCLPFLFSLHEPLALASLFVAQLGDDEARHAALSSVRELRARLGFGSLSTGSSASSISSAADTHAGAPDADGLAMAAAMPRRVAGADNERHRSHSVGPLLEPPMVPSSAPSCSVASASPNTNHLCASPADSARRFSMQNLDLVHLMPNPVCSLIHYVYVPPKRQPCAIETRPHLFAEPARCCCHYRSTAARQLLQALSSCTYSIQYVPSSPMHPLTSPLTISFSLCSHLPTFVFANQIHLLLTCLQVLRAFLKELHVST